MIYTIIFPFLSGMVHHTMSQYGNPCSDRTWNTMDACCNESCEAYDDIRRLLLPNLFFDASTANLCCPSGCRDVAAAGVHTATPRPKGAHGERISERKCAEYDKVRKKTNSYHYFDDDEFRYGTGPAPIMYSGKPQQVIPRPELSESFVVAYISESEALPQATIYSSVMPTALPSEYGYFSETAVAASSSVFPSEESAVPVSEYIGIFPSRPTPPASEFFSLNGDPALITEGLAPEAAALGGTNAVIYEFPHMAAIGWYLNNGRYSFNCGGTLISDRFVLTAGHCVSKDTYEPAVVRLGDLNILEDVSDGAKPLEIQIKRVVRHPDYKPPCKYFDIALLELQAPVPLSSHIHPACLWTKSNFDGKTYADVTGWGTSEPGSRRNSEVLQKVKLDILDTSLCESLLKTARNRNWQGFSDHQLCAGVLAGGRDACQGDSGGPLQIKVDNQFKKYHVIGVTSFGRECGKPNLPGVYTRVSAFIDWIESVVWPTE